jgi:hypothetical protein
MWPPTNPPAPGEDRCVSGDRHESPRTDRVIFPPQTPITGVFAVERQSEYTGEA